MRQIALANGKGIALVDDDDFEAVSRHRWRINPGKGIAVAKIGGKDVKMHRWLLNAPKDKEVDHINGNHLDNRRSNLRLCSRFENAQNIGPTRNNTSGFKGVSWNRSERRWAARIMHHGEDTFLGYFRDAEEAAKAYDRAARQYHGLFARTNFQEDGSPALSSPTGRGGNSETHLDIGIGRRSR